MQLEMKENQLFNLSNEVIVEYLVKNLNLADTIGNNPYFIYKLFDIFSIEKGSINSIKVYDNRIIITTEYYEYEIVLNGNNGLTAIIDDQSDDYNGLYFTSRRIVEVIPNARGIMIINNKEVINGSLIDFNCELVHELKFSSISSDGIEDSVEGIFTKDFYRGELFLHKIDIQPYTIDEYKHLLDKLKTKNNKSYMHIDRIDLRKINISQQYNGEMSNKTKVFSSKSLLKLIDLNEANYNKSGLNREELILKLLNYKSNNNIEERLTEGLLKRLGVNVSRYVKRESNLEEQRQAEILLKPGNTLK